MYADVLGWSNLVMESENEEPKRSLIAQAVHWWRYPQGLYRIPGIAQETRCHFTLASDSIFASVPAESEYFRDLVIQVSSVLLRLLRKGIYVRGSIVAGSLLHDREVVVGPAVVTAVGLERSTCYPRIAIHESVFRCLVADDEWVYRGADGVPTLDYIRFGRIGDDRGVATDAREILKTIERKIAVDAPDARLLEKHQWMKAYLEHLAMLAEPATIS